MKTYKIAGGQIIDRETGEIAEQIHGTITKVDIQENDKGTKFLVITFKDGDQETSLRVKLFGDASLKLLRCLYGAASTLAEQPVTVTLEQVEGAPNLIHVLHGSRELMALGNVPPYADLRGIFIHTLLGTVKTAAESKFPVAVVAISRNGQPLHFDDPTADEVADMIREAIASGNRGGVAFRKHVFASPALAEAFTEGACCMGRESVYVTDSPDSIETLDAAWQSQTENTGNAAIPEDNEEA